MPVVKELKELLDKQNIKYVTISHSLAYTALETAELAHVSGKEIAKTVIVKVDGVLAMAVLPASLHIDVPALKSGTGAQSVELAREPEFSGRFAGCETGAMPPFGNLYGMSVFVDESLTKDKEIAFNAGTHNELIRLSYADFEALVKPTVLNFVYRGAGTSAA